MLARNLLCLFLLFLTFTANSQVGLLVKETKAEEKVVATIPEISYADLEKLKSPRDAMRTFINSMERVKAGDKKSFEEAISVLDLSLVNENIRSLTGKIAAERLINTIDRISKIQFEHIPTYQNGAKWYFRKQTVSVGDRIYEVEIALEKSVDGAWRFSPETVSSIDKFYASLAHLKVVSGVVEYTNWKTSLKDSMPLWTHDEFMMFKKGQWLGLFILFFLSLLVVKITRVLALKYVNHRVNLESLPFKKDDQYRSTLPFGLLSFSLVWMFGVRVLEFDIVTLAFLVRTFYILIAFSSVWSLLKIVDYISMHFEKVAHDTENKFDDVLVPMLKKSSKVLVVSFGAILVAHSLTFDVASILAGLGIGGVAVALAAKDTISNLFGSVTVIMDRPFLIGDYVFLDKSLEGTIEQVGFRSTRIRTPAQSLVSLPNNVLANMAIDNYGMRTVRRFKTLLQVEYSTPVDKIEEFCERLRYTCKIHQLIVTDTAQIYVHEMGESSINILMNIFFDTVDPKIELEERHKLILEILKIAKEMDVHFAYPTRTLMMEETSKKWQSHIGEKPQ